MIKIRKSAHCMMCEHYSKDVNIGVQCQLTGKRPQFGNKCDHFRVYPNRFFERIEDINIQYQKVVRSKTLMISNVIFYTIVMLAFVISGYLLGLFYFDNGVISVGPLAIMAVGLFVLPLAIGPWNKYRSDLNVVTSRKNELDATLQLYGFEYDIKQIFKKGNHDFFEVDTNISVRKNGQTFQDYQNQKTVADKKKVSEMGF